jgi:hypothetical protein
MSWHGFLIVGDQHAPVVCCQGQHLRIAQTRKASSRCGLEIQSGRTADDRMQNDLVQIRVSLKAEDHACVVWRCRLASPSF